jgi:hypothetical protein
MEANRHCYEFKIRSYPKGFLDPSVDATYVIHLIDNGRYDAILKEVDTFQPTKTLWFVLNQGFRACPKTLPKQSAGYDLADATMQIYTHAAEMGYENILVLEDDCFFHEDLKNPSTLQDLNTIFQQKKATSFSYRLGCIPALMVPFLIHSPIGLYAGAHAYVVSESFRTQAANQITDIDEYLNLANNQYAYYKPLAYQLFPETENKTTWGTNISIFPYIFPILSVFFKLYIRLIGLDVRPEPGFSFAYLAAKALFILATMSVILIPLLIIGIFFLLRKIELHRL